MRIVACFKGTRWVALAFLGVALPLGLLGPPELANRSHAANPTSSQGEITGQWWQWVLGIPTSQNPLLDTTGQLAGTDQPYKGNKVFFLVGTAGGGSAERTITVPRGTSFFFPVVNVFFVDSIGRGKDKADNPTVPQMYAILAGEIASVSNLYATLNGASLLASAQRLQSTPFAVKLPADNIFDAPAGEYAPGVSDGYWVYLAGLAPGSYDLKFGGFIGAFTAQIDIIYHITILP
jgi:hypothetical protein